MTPKIPPRIKPGPIKYINLSGGIVSPPPICLPTCMSAKDIIIVMKIKQHPPHQGAIFCSVDFSEDFFVILIHLLIEIFFLHVLVPFSN